MLQKSTMRKPYLLYVLKFLGCEQLFFTLQAQADSLCYKRETCVSPKNINLKEKNSMSDVLFQSHSAFDFLPILR